MATRAPKLMLLDTASLYFRAFFGVPETVQSPDGHPVNAVRGLLDFITRLVTDHGPTHLTCCWDDDWRPAWRVALLPSYKAHRVTRTVANGPDIEETPPALVKQIPLIREVLAALGIAVVGAAHFEADDVVATLATGASMPVDVVTGDRDLIQLVDDKAAGGPVRVLYTGRGVGRLEILDDAAVEAKYGVPPGRYADLAVLRGDPSDGLPGVPGVGDKTAASLIHRHGGLDAILAAAGDEDSGMAAGLRQKLQGAAEYLAVAPDVVRVCREITLTDDAGDEIDLEIPDVPVDPTAFDGLAERWGLGSSAQRVVAALSGAAGA